MPEHDPSEPLEPQLYHGGSRFTNYRTYLKTLRNRLRYVEEKEEEWKRQHPGDQPASYYKTERNTIRWVLELISCFVPEEYRPAGAPIPIVADECPMCRGVTKRLHDGMKRKNPWQCYVCGYRYATIPEEK